MRRLIVVTFSAAVTSIAMSLVLVSQAGAAPNVQGESFSQAQATLSGAGYSAVMSTKSGDRVSQGDCIVVRQETTLGQPFLGSSGPNGTMNTASGKPKVLLSLDCNPQPK